MNGKKLRFFCVTNGYFTVKQRLPPMGWKATNDANAD